MLAGLKWCRRRVIPNHSVAISAGWGRLEHHRLFGFGGRARLFSRWNCNVEGAQGRALGGFARCSWGVRHLELLVDGVLMSKVPF